MSKRFLWPIICLLVLILGGLIYLFYPKITGQKLIACPINWKNYHNELLGVDFCYNPSWGTPQTEPIENLTNLEEAADQSSSKEDNGYSNRIVISFDKNRNVSLNFFNDKYKGEYYPNAGAVQYGYIDNFSKLKSTSNICDYKIDFNTSFFGKLKTVWDNCQNKVKIALVQDKKDYNNKILYEYTLTGKAFYKTQNSFFDNLVATINFGVVNQRSTPIASLRDIFSGNLLERNNGDSKIGQPQYNQEKQDFEIFANSIKAYKPAAKVTPEFKVKSGEDSDITIIRHYYYYLANGQFQNAYGMYLKPQLDLAKYTDQYKNIFKAEPRDFTKKSDHQYEFYVDYQENNTEPTVYHVVMNINTDKVETIMSEEITSPMVKSDLYTAYAKRVDNKNYMVLLKEGKENIIDEGEVFNKDYSNSGRYFSRPEFSSSNKYLFYETSGWEWTEGNVYDVLNNKKLFHTGEFVGDHGFTKNEKYFFNCSSPGFSGGQGMVWSLNDGKTAFDIFDDKINNGYMDIQCQNNKGDDFISFILSQFSTVNGEVAKPDKTVKFSL